MRGIFTAAVLAALEEDFGIRILDHVDLVAGTSTGGILALALAAGMRPAEVLQLYVDHQHEIFQRRSLRPGVVRARYRSAGLHRVLLGVLGERTLSESRCRLVIPSFNLGDSDVYIFRTPHHERLRRDWRVAMVDVALATSAAPTYLPGHRLDSVRLVDGGVWANNPAMVGLVEAVETCGQPLEAVRLLSLGTTAEARRRPNRLDRGGLAPWAMSIVDVMLIGQAKAASNHCRLLLGTDRFHRLDPVVPVSLTRLDRVHPPDLIGRARAESRNLAPALAEFFSHRSAPFVPLYTSTPKEKPC